MKDHPALTQPNATPVKLESIEMLAHLKKLMVAERNNADDLFDKSEGDSKRYWDGYGDGVERSISLTESLMAKSPPPPLLLEEFEGYVAQRILEAKPAHLKHDLKWLLAVIGTFKASKNS
jgi:hypothetical protein